MGMLQPTTPVQITQRSSTLLLLFDSASSVFISKKGNPQHPLHYTSGLCMWVLPTDTLLYLRAFHNLSHPGGGQGWLLCENLLPSEKVSLLVDRGLPSTSIWSLCKKDSSHMIVTSPSENIGLFVYLHYIIMWYFLCNSFLEEEKRELDGSLCFEMTEGIRFFTNGGMLLASERGSPRAGFVPTCLLWCRAQ